MKYRTTRLHFLFITCFFLHVFTANAVNTRPIAEEKHKFPQLIERVLFQKMPALKGERGKHLMEKREQLAERYAAEEELRDPIKKWFWNAFFLFVGGWIIAFSGILLGVEFEAKEKDNLIGLAFGITILGFISIFAGFICGIIWLLKLFGA